MRASNVDQFILNDPGVNSNKFNNKNTTLKLRMSFVANDVYDNAMKMDKL
jgi:hypothetical protein